MFGCGTGVVVVSIKEIQYESQIHAIPYCSIVRLLRDTLAGIQMGTIMHPWGYVIPPWEEGQAGLRVAESDTVLA
jgi:branched-chain amino acid aminotransferase